MNITRLNGDAAGERNCEFYMLIYSCRFSRAAPAKNASRVLEAIVIAFWHYRVWLEKINGGTISA